MAKIIGVLNHKGGVGKTTTAVNLGVALSKDHKVLLVDLDSQANLTSHLGFSPSEKNIYTALRGECELQIAHYKDVDVVCSHIDLSAADMEFISSISREFLLKNLIDRHLGDYDYVVLDCAPNLGLLTMNALAITNLVIIPIELSFFALSGMAKLIEIIKMFKARVNKNLEDYKILASRTDLRKTAHRDILSEIRKMYPEHLLKTYIRSNVKIEESQLNRTDIFTYAATSKGAEDYENLCEEIVSMKL